MTQHQMDSGEINRDSPQASYPGYEGIPHYDRYPSASLGQKIYADHNTSSSSGRGRFALAIISLILWVIVFGIIGLGASAVSPDNPSSHFLYPFLFAALVIFSVRVLAINILFHRKR